jgi:hypothetical protein
LLLDPFGTGNYQSQCTSDPPKDLILGFLDLSNTYHIVGLGKFLPSPFFVQLVFKAWFLFLSSSAGVSLGVVLIIAFIIYKCKTRTSSNAPEKDKNAGLYGGQQVQLSTI